MLIGEAPGATEDLLESPFTGQAGKLLNHVVGKLGLSWEDLYVTNLLKCRPEGNKLPPKKELDECVAACHEYLAYEVRTVKPKALLVLGGTSLKYLTGQSFIAKWEGMEVGKMGKLRTFAAFHPAYVLRAPSKEASLARAIARAARAAGLRRKAMGIEAGRFQYEVRM
jgi:DNA polymerase